MAGGAELLGDPLLEEPPQRPPARTRRRQVVRRAVAGLAGAAALAFALRPAGAGPDVPDAVPSPPPGGAAGVPAVGVLAWPARGPGAGDPGVLEDARRALRQWDAGGSLPAVPLWSGDLPDGSRLVVVAAPRGRGAVVVTALADGTAYRVVDVDERELADATAVRWLDRDRDGATTLTSLLPPGTAATVTTARVGRPPVADRPLPDTDGLVQVVTDPGTRVTGLAVDGVPLGPDGAGPGAPPLPSGLLGLERVQGGERQLRGGPDRLCLVHVVEQTVAPDEQSACLPLPAPGPRTLLVGPVGAAPATAASVRVVDDLGVRAEARLRPLPGTAWRVFLLPRELPGRPAEATAHDAGGRVLARWPAPASSPEPPVPLGPS